MKKRRFQINIIIITLLISCILTLACCRNNAFNTHVQVTNNTKQDLDITINVSRKSESDSSQENIFALNRIEKDKTESTNISLKNTNEDFGIIIKIGDSSTSYYYTSADNLEYINILIQIDKSEKGDAVITGTVESKRSMGTPTIETLEDIELKGKFS